MKKHYRVENNCLNCSELVTGKFCSECGQENIEVRENFWSLLTHSVSHYFHFDNKFFNSFIPLITKPGYLTNEYNAGRRVSHLPPVTMYLFISFIFFLFVLPHQNWEAQSYKVLDQGREKELFTLNSKLKSSNISAQERTNIEKKIDILQSQKNNGLNIS